MNKRLQGFSLLFGVLAGISLSARADDGFFVAGSIGSSTFEDRFGGAPVDIGSTAYRFELGWRFSDYMSLEAGYHNFGNFRQRFDLGDAIAVVETEADGLVFGTTLSLPVSETWSLFARGGGFVWEADTRIGGEPFSFRDDTRPYYGAGAEVRGGPHFSVAGDWTRYELEGPDCDVVSIGLRIRF